MGDSKTVTQLRKSGQIDEALTMAREVIRDDPHDVWNIRAYGWALHDAIKARAKNDLPDAKKLVDEFNRLEIPEDEDLLLTRREYYSSIADPSFKLLQTAKAKSKDDQHQEAMRIYREAVKQSPTSKEACEGLAWEIWRALKDLPKDSAANQITPLLREYGSLNEVEKPSDIHSRILGSATWVAAKLPNYIQFVKWWNLKNIRYEDKQQQYSQKNEKYFDSLVERVIKALHQAGKKHDDPADFNWISKFMADNYADFPSQEWFPYYYGKALAKTGDLDVAREIILPIVRAKQSEFWAWDVLASTFTDVETRKACLCKSLSCKVKADSFRVNVHEDLAAILQTEGSLPEAKCEYLAAIKIRETEGWKVAGSLQSIQQENWFSEAEQTQDNRALYEACSANVQDILTAVLPWEDALISGRREGTQEKKPLLFVGTKEGQTLDEVPVNPSKFPSIKALPIGSPIRIKSDDFGDRKIIVAIEQRDADPWDILPSIGGVVSHVNKDKKIVHVTTSKTGFCLLYYDRFPEAAALKPGSFVGIKMRKDTKRNKNHAVSFHLITALPEGSDYYKQFDGCIRINDGNAFGFIDDYYVSPTIITNLSLEDGSHIRGSGICEWNERKRKYSWSAVTVVPVSDG